MVDQSGKIRLTDGTVTSTWGIVQLQFQLGTGKAHRGHEMVVTHIEAPVVIGMGFFETYQCVLDMRTHTLITNGGPWKAWHMSGSGLLTVIIPPMSEMIIPGEIQETPYVTQGILKGV